MIANRALRPHYSHMRSALVRLTVLQRPPASRLHTALRLGCASPSVRSSTSRASHASSGPAVMSSSDASDFKV